MESVTVVVLLPCSSRTASAHQRRPGEGHLWFYALLVLAVAIAGKFGGSTIAARMPAFRGAMRLHWEFS
jgi:hypothetical protein